MPVKWGSGVRWNEADRPRFGHQLEPPAGREGRRGLGPADRQLLAAGEGAGVQRHPVVGHADRPREAADHAGLHRPDAAGHHPGHRRRGQPDPRRADPARGSGLHQHRVHGVGARQELQQHLLHAVLDRRDRRRVPLVGGEPQPAAQGRDRHAVLQGRRAAQAQGGLHAAGELPVLLRLLPADVLVAAAPS